MARPNEFDRELVLDKAMLLFWNKGYFNTSSQDIVEHLGLNRSSIYNSFTDKRSLFIESLHYYIRKESEALFRMLEKLPPDTRSIKKLLEQVAANNFSGVTPKGCLIVNTAIEFSNHDEAIKQIIEANTRQTVAAFKSFIKTGQAAGTFRKTMGAGELAVFLFHQVTALRVTGKVITDKPFFNKTIHACVQLFNN